MKHPQARLVLTGLTFATTLSFAFNAAAQA